MTKHALTKVAKKARERDLSSAVLSDRVMQHLNDAALALDEAATIPEYKVIADCAAAQEIFAARQGLSDTVIGKAHAGTVRA